jgi:hypothetical protein
VTTCHACHGTRTDAVFGSPCTECREIPVTNKRPKEDITAMPAATKKTTATKATPAKRSIDWSKYGARQAQEGDAQTWRPTHEADTITGTLVKVDEVNTRFGEKVVIELADCVDVIAGEEDGPDGPYTIWPTPGLLDALAEAEADKGSTITITLDELVDTGKGNPFKKFGVVDA